MLLENNHVITIGDARLRFTLDSSGEGTAEMPILAAELLKSEEEPHVVSSSGSEFNQTILHADELTALLNFMTASLTETTLHGLVNLALTAVLKQTVANVAGFLSLDEEEPEFRLVLPAQAEVDAQLEPAVDAARAARKAGGVARLGPDAGLDSESLVAFRDAVVRSAAHRPGVARRTEDASAEPLGALHVYKANRLFSEREVRFCEVLAGCLAGTLHVLRARRALEADNSRLRDHAAGSSRHPRRRQPGHEAAAPADRPVRPLPCTVLITGESGVGKELVRPQPAPAEPRHEGPLVTLNCAAIPATLAESELFGHKKGAFTGADGATRPAAFLRPIRARCFSTKSASMPLPEQAKLLRVLETQKPPPRRRRRGGQGGRAHRWRRPTAI